MNLETAKLQIDKYFTRMNQAYGRVVFDEWLIVSRQAGSVHLLHYQGPRAATIMESLADETSALRQSGAHIHSDPGQFDFTREGAGSDFDAYVCVGKDCFLLCNNTQKSMQEVSADTNWLSAQGEFLNLSQYFVVDGLSA